MVEGAILNGVICAIVDHDAGFTCVGMGAIFDVNVCAFCDGNAMVGRVFKCDVFKCDVVNIC